MKSPFPGIDPFVEAFGLWKDFHDSLIVDLARALSAVVPDRYVVRFGERAYFAMEENEATEFTIRHDMAANVVASATAGDLGEAAAGATTLSFPAATFEEPVMMQAHFEAEFREPYIEILDCDSEGQLGTVIELLSPSNKHPGSPGWNNYLRKRSELLRGAAHFVEIDFLRGGRRMPMKQPWPDSPYHILVSRRFQAPTCKVWPVASLRPVPALVVPLQTPNVDNSQGIFYVIPPQTPDINVVVELQPLIDFIYKRGRYRLDIDYRREIPGLLNDEERKLLKEKCR